MRRMIGSTFTLALLFLGCGPEKPAEAPNTAPAPVAGAAPAAPGTQVAPAAATLASAPKPAAPGAIAKPVTPSAAHAAAAPSPAAPATEHAPKAAPAAVSEVKPATAAPSAAPSVAAPAAPGPMPTLAGNGHAAIGADKCRMCHRVQHDSWSASAHAKKGLDCEACHGNGADYKAMPVMKNPAAAKAAGLVKPGADFCRKCHGAKADVAFLTKAHAHKA